MVAVCIGATPLATEPCFTPLSGPSGIHNGALVLIRGLRSLWYAGLFMVYFVQVKLYNEGLGPRLGWPWGPLEPLISNSLKLGADARAQGAKQTKVNLRANPSTYDEWVKLKVE